MKKELPIMIFHKDNQDYYGGDQDFHQVRSVTAVAKSTER